MSAAYLLSCDSYKNNIFSGLTHLQEEQEFVDLTLAADGYLVKVHKNIIALASPYLKEMIKSTSSQNPVIFLNNVKHNILNYLLEYIYQGEVRVPQESLQSFIQISASLHITGINKIIQPKPNPDATDETEPQATKQNPVKLDLTYNSRPIINVAGNTSIPEPKIQTPVITLDATCVKDEKPSGLADISITQPQVPTPMITIDPTDTERPSNFAASITINSDHNLDVQQFAGNKQDLNVDHNYANENAYNYGQSIINADINSMPVIEAFEGNYNHDANNMEVADINYIHDHELNSTSAEQEQVNLPTITAVHTLNSANTYTETPLLDLAHLNKEAKDALKLITQYSVSERGAIQIIVSRFIYRSHHKSRGGRKHRWRCLEYRCSRCPAYIDSFDGRIISRKGIHSHPFHDSKIYKKHQQHRIFSSFQQALEATELPVIDDDAFLDVEEAVEFSVIGPNTNEGDK